MSSGNGLTTWSSRCAGSLGRSRARREATRRLRRRRLRTRGGGASVAAAALAVAVVGAGAAVGHTVRSSTPSKAAQTLLAKGSNGPAVAALERALGMPADGFFDERTEANVRRFQTRHGLLADGIVGPQTRAALGVGGGAASSRQRATTAGGGAPGGLQRIAQCESGGDPGAVGGGGRYRGKYQFTRETWRALGGSGDPAAAPEAEQDQRAAILYRRGGASQWPSCG